MKQSVVFAGVIPVFIFLLLFLSPAIAQNSESETPPDETAPFITEGVVESDGTVVKLIASESLTTKVVEGNGGFTIPSHESIIVERIVAHESTIALALSGALPEGVSVTILYNPSEDDTAAITDSAGNPLASGSSVQVERTVQTPPAQPDTVTDPVVEESVVESRDDETPPAETDPSQDQSAPEEVVPLPPVEMAWLTSYKGNSGNEPVGGDYDRYWVALADVSEETAVAALPWDTAATYSQGDAVQVDGAIFASNVSSNTGNHPRGIGHHYVKTADGSWIAVTDVPAWQASTTYAKGDLVVDNGVVYRRSGAVTEVSERPSATVAETPASAWSETVSYEAGEAVQHNGVRYESTESSNTGNQPTDAATFIRDESGTNWVSFDDISAWDTATTYGDGAIVLHNGSVYRSLVSGNVGYDPSAQTDGSVYYQQSDGTVVLSSDIAAWAEQTAYAVGDLVVHNNVVYTAAAASVSTAPADGETSWKAAGAISALWESLPGTALWRAVPSDVSWVAAGSVTAWSIARVAEAWDAGKEYRYGDLVLAQWCSILFIERHRSSCSSMRTSMTTLLPPLSFPKQLTADVPSSITLGGVTINVTHVVIDGKECYDRCTPCTIVRPGSSLFVR